MTAFIAVEYAPRRTALWLAAATCVATAHAGAAYVSLSRWPSEIMETEPQGAISIELAPLVSDASEPEAELARAEETTETVAPMFSEQAAPDAAPEDVPIAALSPAPDPELVVPIRKPLPLQESKAEGKSAETRDEPEPDVKAVKETRATPVSPPPQAAAPVASLSASVSPAKTSAAAPSKLGKSRKPSKEQVSWQKSLLLQLDRNKRYPVAARRQQLAGVVTVGFVIDRQGRVLSSRIAKSSGVPLLDQEAVDVLSRASPLPAPPQDLRGETLSLSMPIQFRFQN